MCAFRFADQFVREVQSSSTMAMEGEHMRSSLKSKYSKVLKSIQKYSKVLKSTEYFWRVLSTFEYFWISGVLLRTIVLSTFDDF